MNIHKAPNPPQVKAELFFGRGMPTEGMIDPIAFTAFLREEIAPTFPGFTVSHVDGWWKGEFEPATVVTILAADSDSLRNSIRMIAERYKTRFNQEAVAYSFTACEFTLDCWPYGPTKAYHRDGKGY